MFRLDRLVALALVGALASFGRAGAQVTDTTTRRAPAALMHTPGDSLTPPISPRRAFFYSFLLPGFSQTVLGRHKAAAGFMFVEGMALVMIRESGAETHEARRAAEDSVVVSYVDQNGNVTKIVDPPRFGGPEIHARNAHVEDWVALLVGNHLLAGADAFVSAHLWDVPTRLGFRRTPNGTALTASFTW